MPMFGPKVPDLGIFDEKNALLLNFWAIISEKAFSCLKSAKSFFIKIIFNISQGIFSGAQRLQTYSHASFKQCYFILNDLLPEGWQVCLRSMSKQD